MKRFVVFSQEFLRALKSEDIALLDRIYADDYLPVRPNGDTLNREWILADRRQRSMRFTSWFIPNVDCTRIFGFYSPRGFLARFRFLDNAGAGTGVASPAVFSRSATCRRMLSSFETTLVTPNAVVSISSRR